jgi:hypothetical protein
MEEGILDKIAKLTGEYIIKIIENAECRIEN